MRAFVKYRNILRVIILYQIDWQTFESAVFEGFGAVPKEYVVKYVDDEGDTITVTTEFELQEAFSIPRGDKDICLFVEEKAETSSDSTTAASELINSTEFVMLAPKQENATSVDSYSTFPVEETESKEFQQFPCGKINTEEEAQRAIEQTPLEQIQQTTEPDPVPLSQPPSSGVSRQTMNLPEMLARFETQSKELFEKVVPPEQQQVAYVKLIELQDQIRNFFRQITSPEVQQEACSALTACQEKIAEFCRNISSDEAHQQAKQAVSQIQQQFHHQVDVIFTKERQQQADEFLNRAAEQVSNALKVVITPERQEAANRALDQVNDALSSLFSSLFKNSQPSVPAQPEQPDNSIPFISTETFSNGFQVLPGITALKQWIIGIDTSQIATENGQLSEVCSLQFMKGDPFRAELFHIRVLQKNRVLVQVSVFTPEQPGRYLGIWQLTLPNANCFLLNIDINVRPELGVPLPKTQPPTSTEIVRPEFPFENELTILETMGFTQHREVLKQVLRANNGNLDAAVDTLLR